MKTCFPSRKKNGENYATLDEMMALLGQEPHGSWLAGTNNMWHGGIHISEISAPGSVLKPNMAETAVPLQCMADGEVVAWRLNKDYQKSTYLSQPVQYTTTFVLVKSTCLPDKGKEQTQLDFYSLYMGLAPLSAFEKRKCMVTQKKVIKRDVGKYESSRQSGDAPHAPKAIGRLPKGARILILEETEFLNKPVSPKARPGTTERQPFGLAQAFDKNGKLTEEKFWVTLLPGYMTEEGEQYAHLPFWMQKAVEQGIFDAVAKPATALKISAGDAIGFLGEDIAPMGRAKTSRSTYAHIEVLSADSRMPAFLDNPGKVTAGRKYIRVHPTAKLYTLSGGTFSNTGNPVEKDRHIILPVDKCKPKKRGGKTWYQVGQSYWLNQDDVDLIDQYNLKELGFTALAEETTSDMSASLQEGWMKSGLGRLAEQVRPERGIREQQMSSFYKGMIDKMDTDKDGQLSERELFAALQHPEMGVRDIVARMIVKHQSEWFGGSSHQKWTAFFQNYDALRINFAKKWLDDMEWMSQVELFSSGQGVWHMHPVVFLDAIKTVDSGFITLSMVLAANLGANEAQCEKVLPYLNKYANAYGMQDKREIAHFLSQIGHESGFTITEENLNYSRKGMRRIFGCKKGPKHYNKVNDDCDLGRLRGKLWTHELTYAHHPENLANYVYADRMGNKSEGSGDGYKYRGRGMIQLTGKDGYRYFTNMHNKKSPSDRQDFVAEPDLVISNVEYGVESAFSFWVSKGLNMSAKSLSVYDVTYKVNGGYNGYNDRRIRFNKVAKLLGINND